MMEGADEKDAVRSGVIASASVLTSVSCSDARVDMSTSEHTCSELCSSYHAITNNIS